MLRIHALALAFTVAAAFASPVKADNAALASCQASAQASYYHDIALCEQRGFGYGCQQDALTRFEGAWADCAKRYGG